MRYLMCIKCGGSFTGTKIPALTRASRVGSSEHPQGHQTSAPSRFLHGASARSAFQAWLPFWSRVVSRRAQLPACPLTASKREESILGMDSPWGHRGQPHSPPGTPPAERRRSSLLSQDPRVCGKAGGRPTGPGGQEVKVSRDAEGASGAWRSLAAHGVVEVRKKQRRVCKSFRPRAATRKRHLVCALTVVSAGSRAMCPPRVQQAAQSVGHEVPPA